MDGASDSASFLANYDPRAYDPVAVTVDVVALTIRDAGLQVLLVRRGEQPYRGTGRCPAASSGRAPAPAASGPRRTWPRPRPASWPKRRARGLRPTPP